MLSLLAVLLGAPTPGVWLPTRGPAGVRAVVSIAEGGDGALYALGSGTVFRMGPKAAGWRAIGSYVPTLRWDGEAVEAEHPNRALARRTVEEIEEALEATLGDDLGEEGLSPDLVADVIRNYVEETETRVGSVYHVAGLARATRGVWIGTGAGLFWADAKGVRGPVGRLDRISGLAATPQGLVVSTNKRVYRVAPDGHATPWTKTRVSSLTGHAGGVAYLEGATLWLAKDTPVPALPPTGRPRLLAGDANRLWVATGLAIYRYDTTSTPQSPAGARWHLCAALPEAPTRLVTLGTGVAAVTDEAIFMADQDCARYTRQEVPWPGGMRFTDVVWVRNAVYVASSEGVFRLGPPDKVARDEVLVRGFRRAVSELPSYTAVVRDTFAYNQLEPEIANPGMRPLLRQLLPEVRIGARTWPSRTEAAPTLIRGNEVLITEPPKLEFAAQAQWSISFDSLAALVGLGEEGGDVELDEDTVEFTNPTDDFAGELDVEVVDVSTDDPEAGATQVFAKALSEARHQQRARASIQNKLRQLYRERLRLMFRLWMAAIEQTQVLDTVLRLQETDAMLDAYTGGTFTRRQGTNQGAPQ